MTFEECQEVWKQQQIADATKEATAIANRVAQSQRRQKRMANLSLINTGAFVTFVIYGLSSGKIPTTDLGPVLAFSGATVALVAGLARLRYHRWKRPASEGAALGPALQWSLSDTVGQIRELGLALAAAVIFVLPAAVWSVSSLLDSGRMDARSATGFSTMLAAVLVANLLGWGGYYLAILAPRRERLERLVALFGE